MRSRNLSVLLSSAVTVPWKNGAPTKIVRQDLPGCRYLLISLVSGTALRSCVSETATKYCQHIAEASRNLMIVMIVLTRQCRM